MISNLESTNWNLYVHQCRVRGKTFSLWYWTFEHCQNDSKLFFFCIECFQKIRRSEQNLAEHSDMQRKEIETWKSNCEQLTTSLSKKEAEINKLLSKTESLEKEVRPPVQTPHVLLMSTMLGMCRNIQYQHNICSATCRLLFSIPSKTRIEFSKKNWQTLQKNLRSKFGFLHMAWHGHKIQCPEQFGVCGNKNIRHYSTKDNCNVTG